MFSKRNKKDVKNDNESGDVAEATEEQLHTDEAADESTSTEEIPEDEDELSRALRERNEYLGQWQRAKADYQNLRRRHLSEIEASRKRTLMPLLENMLLVIDNLDMALKSECTHQESKNLAMGIQMTRDQFMSALQQEGVTVISSEGIFDPNQHEAVSTVEDSGREAGEIVDTVRVGYSWGEQVLRPAHVRVVASPEPEATSELGSEPEANNEAASEDQAASQED